jgi:hypothetical protein
MAHPPLPIVPGAEELSGSDDSAAPEEPPPEPEAAFRMLRRRFDVTDEFLEEQLQEHGGDIEELIQMFS